VTSRNEGIIFQNQDTTISTNIHVHNKGRHCFTGHNPKLYKAEQNLHPNLITCDPNFSSSENTNKVDKVMNPKITNIDTVGNLISINDQYDLYYLCPAAVILDKESRLLDLSELSQGNARVYINKANQVMRIEKE